MSAEGFKSNGDLARQEPGKSVPWLIALIVVAAVSFHPNSGAGHAMLQNWGDQATFLRSVTQTLEQGLPDAETRNLVGPAYTGFALLVGWLTGSGPADALVLLSRLSFSACAAILATVAMRWRAASGLGLQLAFAGVALLTLITSVWFVVADAPWTHFVAATLLGAMLLVSLTGLPLWGRSVLVGALAITLVQTRLFEAMVALVAGGLLLPLALLRHWRALRSRPLDALTQLALPFVAGSVLGFVAVGAVSHNWSIYQQYADHPGMVLTLGLAPLKAVQLFWDTCFGTICSISASPTASPFAASFDHWQQPLLLQLPGLPAAGAGLLALLIMRPKALLDVPLGVIFAVLAGGGIILAYISGAPSGSPHLKYGFFRDFVPPLILWSGAFIAAVAVQREADGRAQARQIVPLLVFAVVALGFSGLRMVGLPPLSSGHLDRIEIASSCEEGQCAFSLVAIGMSGETVPYDDLAFVNCGDKALPKPVQRVSELKLAAGSCNRLGIIPLASGLLYTPEGAAFLEGSLDLGLAAAKVVVPNEEGRKRLVEK